jgi:predicted O-methyltransferase YrrM
MFRGVARAELRDLPQGWFHHGEKILELVEQHQPRVYVELGSWRGASAIAVARLVRQWRGTVTCVDTWTGDAFKGGAGYEGRPPSSVPEMVNECAGNLVAAGIAASVRLVVASTSEAAKWWTEPIDFLYIDADHDYSSVLSDLEAWVPHVKPGGIVAGDDYGNPSFPGVRMAWNYYGIEHGWTWALSTSPDTPPGMQFIYGVK